LQGIPKFTICLSPSCSRRILPFMFNDSPFREMLNIEKLVIHIRKAEDV